MRRRLPTTRRSGGAYLEPSALKAGLNSQCHLQGISENIIISGSIQVRSAFITRSIGISANTLPGAAPLHQPGDVIWKPAQPPMQAPDLAVRIDPPGGDYTEEQQIQLSCTAPHAVIRFTAATSVPPDPTEKDSEYAGGLLGVARCAVVKARAFDPTWGAGPLAEAQYTLAVPPITVQPDPGVFDGPVPVQLSCPDPKAIIAYTLDGSEPTEGSETYSRLLQIDHTVTLRARAFRDGWQPSQTATGRYELKDAQVEAPEPAEPQAVPSEVPASEVVLTEITAPESPPSEVLLTEIDRPGSVPVTGPPHPSAPARTKEPTPIPPDVEERHQRYRPGGRPSSVFGSEPDEVAVSQQPGNQAPRPGKDAFGLGNAFCAGAPPAPPTQEQPEPTPPHHVDPPPEAEDADPRKTAPPRAKTSGTSIPTWARDEATTSGDAAAPSPDDASATPSPRANTKRPPKAPRANSTPPWLGRTEGGPTSDGESSPVETPPPPAPEAVPRRQEMRREHEGKGNAGSAAAKTQAEPRPPTSRASAGPRRTGTFVA